MNLPDMLWIPEGEPFVHEEDYQLPCFRAKCSQLHKFPVISCSGRISPWSHEVPQVDGDGVFRRKSSTNLGGDLMKLWS
ncbi:hypothetical protein R1flu_005047 [Riccia fluitans]|uniref:Uncharacterized protein n=1 Tax=Riccia fluitans TaxID=41844 RepID=A0ABD1YSD3_9MARC